jgi:hypothetical protein
MAPTKAILFPRNWRPSRPDADISHLLERLRTRWYPGSRQVLAFYWLRTIAASGYDKQEWQELERLITSVVADAQAGTVFADLAAWIRRRSDFVSQSRSSGQSPEPARSNLTSDILGPYVCRLLNEWLPMEVARLLVDESDSSEEGIPGIAIARGIERLLARERVSPPTLEALLDPALYSPHMFNPADVEILRDVVLFLLGRTTPAPGQVLPAALLSVLHDSPLATDYPRAVGRAFLSPPDVQELYVPIGKAQADQILTADRVRIGSIVVTMNGCWWRAGGLLEDREQHLIVHHPMGRLAIDYSSEHTRLRLPWPEPRAGWSGLVDLSETIELFGRQWRVESWERDAEHTWLHVAFLRTLPISRIAPIAETQLRRTRPAAIDIAWTAIENALAEGARQGSSEPIEQLRHTDLIPVGRALFGLVEAVMKDRQAIPARLHSISYMEQTLPSSYGRVPWRVLPEPVRRRLGASELLSEVFDGIQPSRAA